MVSPSVTSTMRPAPRSTISGAPWRLVMMWLWTARSSSFCPWATETAQKGEPHSVSASPPQMSLTSTSSRPSSARTRSNSRSTSDSTVWSVLEGDAAAALRGDHLRGFLDRFGPPFGGGPSPARCVRCSRRGACRAQHAGDAASRAASGAGNDGHLATKRLVRHGSRSHLLRPRPGLTRPAGWMGGRLTSTGHDQGRASAAGSTRSVVRNAWPSRSAVSAVMAR